MCPKCETVWMQDATPSGPRVTRFQVKPEMACPECEKMANSQLMGDGKVMLHECPTCKVTLKEVKPAIRPSRSGRGAM
jgi:hypothetical protein